MAATYTPQQIQIAIVENDIGWAMLESFWSQREAALNLYRWRADNLFRCVAEVAALTAHSSYGGA